MRSRNDLESHEESDRIDPAGGRDRELYASPANVGTVWLGGSSVAVNRGIPITKGSSFFILPLLGASIRGQSIFLFFEKSGDALYGLVVT
jgi:hypothetical protein